MPRSTQSVSCPKCGCRYCPVTKTEHFHRLCPNAPEGFAKDKFITMRTRRCNHCSFKFYSQEDYYSVMENGEPSDIDG